jgi:hypothetical protein
VNGKGWRLFHLWAMVLWLVLAVPTVLWWRESVFWIAVMSLYAIVISHAAAWQAARVEEKADAVAPDGQPE